MSVDTVQQSWYLGILWMEMYCCMHLNPYEEVCWTLEKLMDP